MVIVACGDTEAWREDLELVIQIGRKHGLDDESGIDRKRRNVTHALSIEPNMSMWVAKQTMISATTMMWMAEALGYNTGPMEGFDENRVRDVLGIPDHLRVIFLLAVGKLLGEDGKYPGRLPRLERSSRTATARHGTIVWTDAMPDFAHWSIFLSATTVVLLVPTVMYVMARGIESGTRAVLLSSVGFALGDFLQVIGVTAGLSALLGSSSLLFGIVKYGGAAYLIGLGVRSIHHRRAAIVHDTSASQVRSRTIVLQAFLALNPKTTLCFAALFPQFIAADAGPAWFQMVAFGASFVALGFLTNSAYGCLAERGFGRLARQHTRFHRATSYVSGGALTALGAVSALAPTPRGR